MNEVSLVVSAVVLYFVFKWLLGGDESDGRSTANAGVGRHRVSADMVQMVRSMFPHIPEASIRADLQRTGSVEMTCDNILRNGQLPPPINAPAANPAGPAAAATASRPTGRAAPGTARPGTTAASSSSSSRDVAQESLVKRYNLAGKLDEPLPEQPTYTWESDAAKRQDQLRRRKERMILQARK
ncbi:hypothetical protein IWQ60_000926 [Tieghemiomyces parasiticus]|uniref:CUE domain-containing protein n=1 Tax=Tieghemiomyces parasiticus TaxID=78921 RepID=A0A9W8ALX0_9FUNG|nr:hypothetical protein IWQ60_000926 [Tieghemiomyces parasiticus]